MRRWWGGYFASVDASLVAVTIEQAIAFEPNLGVRKHAAPRAAGAHGFAEDTRFACFLRFCTALRARPGEFAGFGLHHLEAICHAKLSGLGGWSLGPVVLVEGRLGRQVECCSRRTSRT